VVNLSILTNSDLFKFARTDTPYSSSTYMLHSRKGKHACSVLIFLSKMEYALPFGMLLDLFTGITYLSNPSAWIKIETF